MINPTFVGAGSLAQASALVVDDDDFSRHTASHILRRLGVGSVAEAAGGAEALKCVASLRAPLDLILCDLKMPGVDGVEFLRSLAEANVCALIILVSGADSRVLRSARQMAASFGIRSLYSIEKPLTSQKLQGMLAEASADRSASIAEAYSARPTPSIAAAHIQNGLALGEFTPYFQPKVDLATRQIVGTEALVRWVRPGHGVLTPAAFLHSVQTAGMLGIMTDVMVAGAAKHCQAWRAAGLNIPVSVNLSASSLDNRDLPQHLVTLVASQGLAPDHMTFEIVEDGVLDQTMGREILTRLRLQGFGLSIDDFGTGYSTLQQLLEAPFGELKIDQSFVRSAPIDEEAAAAIVCSINLARRLKLRVVGEGIETAAQWRFLQDAGCEVGQGYKIARPMPGEAMAAWAKAWRHKTLTETTC